MTQTKTVGIIGGMGPHATAEFFVRLIEATDALRDQDHLHVVIDSDPTIPDRTLALVDGGPSPAPHLAGVARRLEAMGADLLVMPCNTAHAFAREIVRAVEIPLVSWVAEAVGHVAALEPRPTRVGVLATTGTVTSNVYQDELAAAGIEALMPSEGDQAELMTAIYGLKSGNQVQPAVTSVLEALVDRGANVILLGCTELPSLKLCKVGLPVIDPAEIVVARVIALAGGTLRRTKRAA